jgi:hypothetical protein
LEAPNELKINQLEVSDLMGRIIYRQNKLNTIIQVNISAYPAGLYYLRLIGSNTAKIVKLIKE